MVIAIDFDGTYTADPHAFREIIRIFAGRGHQCIIATNRQPHQTVDLNMRDLQIPIVYASGHPKRKAASEAGYEVHIWIDDKPVMVDEGEPGTWRLENGG